MMYSKSADEMVRELNRLIVEAKETAADTRKYKGADGEAAAVYAQVWEFAARRAENTAGQLEKVLKRVASVAQNPDEIGVRFLIVKAVEDAAFEAGVTAFQVGLMIARAQPEHRAAFEPLCARYDSLAQNARVTSGKIAGFLGELWGLILQDMRKNAQQKIGDAVEAGLAAAGKLSDPTLPYGYIAEVVRGIAEALAAPALEEVTVYGLEDALFRLDTILFAADMDMLRAPQHRQLFDGISDFREKLSGAVEFFRNLSGDAAGVFGDAKRGSERKRTTGKMYSDLAAQEEILLFYLKGEIQKLGNARLDEEQKAALNDICGRMGRAVKLARSTADGKDGSEIAELLRGAYQEMSVVAERLGVYGDAVRYLAEEVKKPLEVIVYSP